MTKDETKDKKKQSFLHEAQKFGRADGEESMKIDDLDKAVADINRIMVPEGLKTVQNTKEEELPTQKLSIYCHDCRAIVPPQIKQVRKKYRKVCGTCGSVKISAGKTEALEKFYHIDEQ